MKNYLIILFIIECISVSTIPLASAIVTVPDPPQNFTATLITGTHNYELDWDAPASDGGSTITGYRIEIAATNTYGTESSHWSLLIETEDTLTNYTHEQTAAYTYCYRVFAVNSEGTSLPSNYANCWTTEAEVPSSIYILDLTAVSGSQIDLSWMEPNDNGLPITGYKIDYKVDGIEYTLVENTGTTDTSYSHTELTADTFYYYKVYAINDLGPGSSYDWDGVKTLSGPIGLPMNPTNLVIYGDYTSLDLRWEAPSFDGGYPIIGYKIEYRIFIIDNTTIDGDWTILVENTDSTSLTYTHTDINSSTTFCYRVSAINDFGVGTPSNEKCGTAFQYEMVPSTKDPTPGFELILFLITAVFIILWKKRKNRI